jgi:hypothetical protein
MDGGVGLAGLAGHRTFDLEAAACQRPATSIRLRSDFQECPCMVYLDGLDSEFWT